MERCDVLIVSLGTTPGWRDADQKLAELLRGAGLTVAIETAKPRRRVRTLMLTDLLAALACRAATRRGIKRYAPTTVVYSTVTASLLWPRRGAIRFDEPGAINRPGWHGLWQRRLERRRLAQAPILIGLTDAGLAAGVATSNAGVSRDQLRVVVPFPIDGGSAATDAERPTTAVTYAANPWKKGVDRVVAAWVKARRDGERLIVLGLEPRLRGEVLSAAGLDYADDSELEQRYGVEFAAMRPYEQYRELLRNSRLFINAPRHEDYGITQLEALADGCRLVTTDAPGSYPALAIAREVDSRLVNNDLAVAIRTALDEPRSGYRKRATELLVPHRPEAVEQVVVEQLAPALR